MTIEQAKQIAVQVAGRIPPVAHETLIEARDSAEGRVYVWLQHFSDGFSLRERWIRTTIPPTRVEMDAWHITRLADIP